MNNPICIPTFLYHLSMTHAIKFVFLQYFYHYNVRHIHCVIKITISDIYHKATNSSEKSSNKGILYNTRVHCLTNHLNYDSSFQQTISADRINANAILNFYSCQTSWLMHTRTRMCATIFF